jgi:hypothetical protein
MPFLNLQPEALQLTLTEVHSITERAMEIGCNGNAVHHNKVANNSSLGKEDFLLGI